MTHVVLLYLRTWFCINRRRLLLFKRSLSHGWPSFSKSCIDPATLKTAETGKDAFCSNGFNWKIVVPYYQNAPYKIKKHVSQTQK